MSAHGTTIGDFKAEVAKLHFLVGLMSGVDPTLEAVHDSDGGLAEMRVLIARAVKDFEEFVAEMTDWPDRVIDLAVSEDLLRGSIETVRATRVNLEKWLGLS